MKMKYIVIFIAFAFTSCEFWLMPDILPIDPDIITEQPQDTTEQDTSAIELPQDTLCTAYTDIINPKFLTVWMEGVEVTQYTLNMYPYSVLINPGDDVKFKVDSLFTEWKGFYGYSFMEAEVFVNENDSRIFSLMIKGTENRNLFNGKFYLRYGNTKHHFGSDIRGYHSPSLSCENYAYVVENYKSVNFVNFRGSPCDSIQTEELAWAILDTANCKGGQDWFDMWFNQYLINQYVIVKAIDADWYIPTHGLNEPTPRIIDLTNQRVSDSVVVDYLNKGYSVKE